MVFFLLLNTLQYFVFAALTETTPITTLTNNSTPEYWFNSDLETGVITYGWSCAWWSLTDILTTGTYTTTLNTLADGTYSDCSLTISGATLSISQFTIDTIPPTITITNSNTTPAQSKTISASTNEWTLTYTVNPIGDTTCNETLTFWAYTAETFTNEADNGKYICYKATDTAWNSSFTLSEEIWWIDTTPPIITLLGSTPIDIEYNSTYIDNSATALDNYDWDITSNIITTNPVNTSVLDSYSVKYNITDAAWNSATEITRTVNVVDTTPAVITLIWTTPVTIEIWWTYTDSGATASDNYDWDITSSIITTNPVDTSIAGIYIIKYNLTDTNGNIATEITRTVNIVDTSTPTITLNGLATSNIEIHSPYIELWAIRSDNGFTWTATISWTVNTGVLWSYIIEYYYSDWFQTWTATKTVNIVDTTPPTSTDDIIFWRQNSDITITLSCNDTWAWCSKIYYTTDNSVPTIWSNYVDNSSSRQFTINTEGDYTITYIAEDIVWNREIPKTASNQAQLDKTIPEFIWITSWAYYNTNQTITFDDTNLSWATLNWSPYTSWTAISSEWPYIFIVEDLAGNFTWATFTIDKTEPTFAGITSWAYYNTNQTITFTDTNLSWATVNGTTYISDITMSSDGIYEFIVTDLAGNCTWATFTIDKTWPIIWTGIISSGNTANNWATLYYNGTITIQTTMSDALAGISWSTCEYSTGVWRASATYLWWTWYCSINWLTPANNINVSFRVQDIASNLNTWGISTYIYDITPPITSDNANTTTGRVDVTVILTPTDWWIGTSWTLYCVDTTNTCTPNNVWTSISLTWAAGVITHKYVRYYSVDKLGNTETIKTSVMINIDKELPILTGTTTFSSNNSTNTWYAKVDDTITVFFQSHETLSSIPIMTISWWTNTGIVTNLWWNNYSGTYVMKSTDVQGTIGFNIFMTDLVGNTGTTFTGSTIIFDRTAPAWIAFTSPLATSYRQNQSGTDYRTITWNTWTESNFWPTSLQIQFSTNGFWWISIISTWTNNDWTFDRTVNSIDTSTAQIRIIATDLAGNRTTITSAAFIIDSTPPVAPTITYPTWWEYFKWGNTYIITRTWGYDDNLSWTILELSTDGWITKNILTSLIGSPNLYARTPATTINSNSVRLGIYLQDKWLLASSHSWILNNFTVDSIKPTLTFADTSSWRRSTNATWTVTTIDTWAWVASTGIVYKTSSAFTDTCDWWTTTPPTFTTDGYRTGYACVMDRAGNIRTGQQSYKIDKTPPTLILWPNIITNTWVTIHITGTDNWAWIASYTRSKLWWTGTITFSSTSIEDPFITGSGDGQYVLQVVVKDNASNITTGTINFYRHENAPVITTGTVTNTTNRTPTFSFTTSNSGSLSRSGTCTSSTTTALLWLNSITLNTLANATYSSCYVRIIDNINTTWARYNIPTFTVNYSAPSWWWGGWGWGGSYIPICTDTHLMCINWIYEIKTGINCQWGDLGKMCWTDICVDGDYSWDPNDGICYDPTKIEAGTGNTTGTKIISTWSRIPYISPYDKELTDAYRYAYWVKITTVSDIQRANLTWVLIRSHLAKMMSQYTTKVLGKKPDTTRNCVFKDMNGQTEEFKNFAILACQLWLMGLKTDGSPADIFNPDDEVNRAIFGTTLSRALFGDTHNGGQNRYGKHLNALKEKAVMNYIDKPFNRELRGYVMLMMMRADQKITKSSYSTFTSLRWSKVFVPAKTTKKPENSQFTQTELNFIENINKNYQFNAGYTVGQNDIGVKYLQYILKSKQYYTWAINGTNTNPTVTALFNFQSDNNIVDTSTDQGAWYLGPSTREILNPLLQNLLNP